MFERKFAAIPMLLVFALVVTGFAYAHWSETLLISGAVDTAELDWEFKAPVSYLDHHGTNDWASDCEWNFWQGNKDVGGPTEVNLIDTDGDGDYDKLSVTLVNAYPSYAEMISFTVHNNGEIPLIFKKVVINGNEFTTGTPTVSLDVSDDGKNDLKIWFGDNLGGQLEPSGGDGITIKICVLQDAPEGQSLTFTIQLVAESWSP